MRAPLTVLEESDCACIHAKLMLILVFIYTQSWYGKAAFQNDLSTHPCKTDANSGLCLDTPKLNWVESILKQPSSWGENHRCMVTTLQRLARGRTSCVPLGGSGGIPIIQNILACLLQLWLKYSDRASVCITAASILCWLEFER